MKFVSESLEQTPKKAGRRYRMFPPSKVSPQSERGHDAIHALLLGDLRILQPEFS